jgi:hypothetical protein
MSSQAGDYRRRGEECRSRAKKAEDDESETFWLDLANRWEQSARKVEQLSASGVVAEGNESIRADFETAAMMRRARWLAAEGHDPEMIEVILEGDGFGKAPRSIAHSAVRKELQEISNRARERQSTVAFETANRGHELRRRLGLLP